MRVFNRGGDSDGVGDGDMLLDVIVCVCVSDDVCCKRATAKVKSTLHQLVVLFTNDNP
jgi:hypothetical protein